MKAKCPNCKRVWGEAPPLPDIPYAKGRGMFPICADCYPNMTFDDVRRHIEALVNLWCQQDPIRMTQHLAAMNQAIGWVRRDKFDDEESDD